MSKKLSLRPVPREITDKYLIKTTNYFWIDEVIQPNFYEAIFRMCEHPDLIRKASSKELGIFEQKKFRYCTTIAGGAKNFNIRCSLHYTKIHIVFRSGRGLAKFIALHVLLCENNLKSFPL